MHMATNPFEQGLARRLSLGLALAALLTGPGCSRLSTFRKTPGPAFGTATASADRTSRPAAGQAPDLYARKLNADGSKTAKLAAVDPKSAGSPASAADGVRSASHSETRPDRAASSGPAVSLQPPVELPPYTKPSDSTPTGSSAWTPAPAAESTTAAAKASAATPTVESVVAACRQRLDALTTYQVVMNHQERVSGRLNPAENVVMSIRRQPKAVRLEWREGSNKGREVLHASDSGGGKMHVKMGDALKALPRLSMAPDSAMATRSSRHPITEAGFDNIVARMEEGIHRSTVEKVAGESIRYLGLETPAGGSTPCHKLERHTPDGGGEVWLVYLDPKTYYPTFVQAVDARGELLERYVFSEVAVSPTELAGVEAFDADARWGPPTGLFGRLARAATDSAPPSRNP